MTTLSDWNNPFFQTELELGFLLWRLDQIPGNGHEWANEWIGNWEVEYVRDRGYNAWQNLQFLNGPGMAVSLGNLLGLGLGGGALADLADGSEAMNLLSEAAWAENGNIRRSFTSTITEGQVGHQFTFLMDPATADYYGDQMIQDGVDTYFAGWGMQMAGEFSGHWDMMWAGSAVMTLGDAETFYWVWWANSIIGSLNSDGVVPLWSQQNWPNVVSENIGNRFHTAETSGLAGQLRQRVNDLFGHPQ